MKNFLVAIIGIVLLSGLVYAITLTTFSDGSSSKTITFSVAGSDTTTAKIKIPKGSTIISVKMDVSGYIYEHCSPPSCEAGDTDLGVTCDDTSCTRSCTDSITNSCTSKCYSYRSTDCWWWCYCVSCDPGTCTPSACPAGYMDNGVSCGDRYFCGTGWFWKTCDYCRDCTRTCDKEEYSTTCTGSYPTNPAIDIGNDGDNEWSYSGAFSTTQTTNDFSAELQSHASTCTCSGCSLDGNNDCTIPIKVSSDSAGKIVLDNLNIVYTKANGDDCSVNEDCTSGYCRTDWDDSGKFCALELNPIIPKDPTQIITIEVGDKTNVLVTVKNIYPERDTITLTLSTNNELFKNWVWFDGYKYDKYRRSLPVILDPDEQMGISINILGGQPSSNNQLIINSKSEINPGDIGQITFLVDIIPSPIGVFAVTPGLNWTSFILIILIASLIIWRRNINH